MLGIREGVVQQGSTDGAIGACTVQQDEPHR